MPQPAMAASVRATGLCLVVLLIGCSTVECRRAVQRDAVRQEATVFANSSSSTSTPVSALFLTLSSVATSGGAGYADTTYLPSWSFFQQPAMQPPTNTRSSSPVVAFEPTPAHKPLLPLSPKDLWLFALSAITLFIAAGGGIGGGAVFVPLFIIIGGFTAAQAVALSNITILGGAVANFAVNSSKRHAFRDRPLIDWDLIMVMEPTTMLGALLGSYTNKLFPGWFTSCLMAALLVLLTYKLLMRGVATFIRETNDQILEHVQQQQQSASSLTAPLLSHAHGGDEEEGGAAHLAAAAADDDGDAAAAADGQDHHAVQDVASKQRCSTAAAAAAPVDSVGSAWTDMGAAAGGGADQQGASPSAAFCHSSSRGRRSSQQHSASSSDGDTSPAGADALVVVPIPPGLKPVATGTTTTVVVQQQQHKEQHHYQSHALSVEGTPRLSPGGGAAGAGVAVGEAYDTSVSPLVWSNPSSATAAQAQQAQEAAAAAICPFTSHAQHKLRHQQQRRQALLLPRHSAAGDDSNWDSSSNAMIINSSSAKQEGRSSCGWFCSCSCLDPRRLQLSTVQAYSRRQLPWQPLLTLFALSCWVVASDTGKAMLPCGSLQYWAVVLSVVPPCLSVTLTVRQWLLARTAVEERAATAAAAASAGFNQGSTAAAAAGAEQREQWSSSSKAAAGIIHWTPRNSIAYPLICSIAGVFAGLFGVGGGIVKGPLMLELGVLPDVAAATSATMIMFTAGSAAVVYLNFGGVVHDYAQALLLLGFVVTMMGQLVATHLVRVLRRRSIIIFAMGLLMLLASVAATYQMGASTVAAWQHPPMWVWGSICQHR